MRGIISRNPPLVDDEGYEPESDDEDYEQRMQDIAETAAEFNPYANVRLESKLNNIKPSISCCLLTYCAGILAPLTSVTDLPSHPTLARPFTTKTLTDLTLQARDTMYKENRALWNIKHLHTKLVGDHIWVPTEMMESPNDIHFFQEPRAADAPSVVQPSVKSDASMLLLEAAAAASSTNGQPSADGAGPTAPRGDAEPAKETAVDGDTSMIDADETIDEDAAADEAPTRTQSSSNQQGSKLSGGAAGSNGDSTTNGGPHEHDKSVTSKAQPTANGETKAAEQNGANGHAPVLQKALNGHDVQLPGSAPMSIASLDALEDMFIHPIFLAPKTAQPNRDLGIPEAEAEDLRRLLQAYVQKQEEVCRGTKRLHEGLLRAERLRKTVFQWSKYEAHVGPNRDMSDGEDWYDKEEWGLEEDLKKGQDEEEEDTTTQQPKKTRARK